ncbi:MAG: type II toxin-antitoxin system RelE/ParE family toxin [Candidatus Palauibacterales bacterium]|nr:type II toxin-antitoxin system RelE/ParE family toxin [Candidatus Palauibacterales bacterium]
MIQASPGGRRSIRWVGSSLEDLRSFPAPVREAIGYALFVAQEGRMAHCAKPLKGISRGASVIQITERHAGDTYRTVYTIVLPGAVHVLHAFRKKSPSGSRTARRDLDLIRARLRVARADRESRDA